MLIMILFIILALWMQSYFDIFQSSNEIRKPKCTYITKVLKNLESYFMIKLHLQAH